MAHGIQMGNDDDSEATEPKRKRGYKAQAQKQKVEKGTAVNTSDPLTATVKIPTPLDYTDKNVEMLVEGDRFWLNIDGVCLMRVSHAKTIVFSANGHSTFLHGKTTGD